MTRNEKIDTARDIYWRAVDAAYGTGRRQEWHKVALADAAVENAIRFARDDERLVQP